MNVSIQIEIRTYSNLKRMLCKMHSYWFTGGNNCTVSQLIFQFQIPARLSKKINTAKADS